MTPLLLALIVSLPSPTAHLATLSPDLLDRVAQPAASARQPCRLFPALRFINILEHGLDLSTTMYGHGRYPDELIEANPALNWTLRDGGLPVPVKHGAVKTTAAYLSVRGATALHDARPTLGCWVMAGLDVFHGWVVISNVRRIQQAGR